MDSFIACSIPNNLCIPSAAAATAATAAAPSVNCRSKVKPLLPVCRFQAVNSSTAFSSNIIWSRGPHRLVLEEIVGRASSFQRTKKKGTSLANSQRVFSLSAGPKLSRRAVVNQSVMAGLVVCSAALAEPSVAAGEPSATKELEKLPFKPEGYNYWTWRGQQVHYVVQGEGKPIVLIHGFGASAYHWRYNIPELAKQGYKVYAMDLLGFGWTDKALIDYSSSLWKDQVADFLREIVGGPAVLAGNSVGGFTVLYTAATNPELVSGLALLNASGQFDTPEQAAGQKKTLVEETPIQKLIFTPAKDFFRKWAIAFAFWQAKQPARIKSVLESVYKDKTNVDDYLVKSIVQPTQDTNAGEAYYRMMTQTLLRSSEISMNKLLAQLKCPLLLLWGVLDPWMGGSKADKIMELYPSATLVRLQAGHCPHDEAPEASNKALLDWMATF